MPDARLTGQGSSRLKKGLTRRRFLGAAAAGVAGGLAITHGQARGDEAHKRLNIALIGCGGRGSYFVQAIGEQGHVFVALCDVNSKRAARAFEQFPDVPKFEDYRVMLDKMHPQVDAVIVSTPDHTHAAPTAAALQAGKPVFCEKPLTHSIHEARVLSELAAKTNLPTQMGNQAGYDVRAVEMVWAKQIGEVREAHAWSGSGGPGPRPLPTGSEQVPDHLNWDLWLGPAADRPYHHRWMGGHHLGWRDFRTGELGQWGSHSLATLFKAMKLDTLWQANGNDSRPIIRVTAECAHLSTKTFPRWEVVRWDIPAREDLPPLRVNWYNGSAESLPRKYWPKLLETHVLRETEDDGVRFSFRHMGSVLVGSELLLHVDGRGTHIQLYRKGEPGIVSTGPENPPQTFSRPLEGKAEQGWTDAILGGPAPMSRFEFSGPFTEFYLLGNVATLFPEQTLEYDPIAGHIVNHDEADAAARPPYREGWTL